ncbi:3-oxoacyl-ACP synthase III family protein [Streptomyces minutiscleroticus]|uniref:3-oxoacyl-[acyl-carrier-protein] synthase 3 n=1 Tax=Streptomyces minutiscleroticus TaxID=68238 RepID=A0A918NIH6_9ACTN|nr:ketoacyl-ACP synthase III [Streptomyces minutiscleroticus]GGX69917.1 3-oxoacyl-[acyl-carrier-protein] synthase 3 [Streptomyces minutiscleroticus]
MTTLAHEPAASHTGNGLSVPFAVTGTGLHVPSQVVTNDDLTRSTRRSGDWITTRTGIHERRRLAPDLATSDMCVAAARPAMEAARITPDGLDAIIVASYTHDQPLPSTALIVKDALGACSALALDVAHAACASGVHAVLLAAHLLQNPSLGTVLVIGADCASRVTRPGDRTAGVFFGDAAAAAVLTRTGTEGAGLLSYDIGSQLSYAVQIPAGGSRRPTSPESLAAGAHYVSMDGRAVWDTATTRLPESITRAVRHAGLVVEDIDHYFLHQANINILDAARSQLGIPADRVPITLDRLGNTGAAGIFTALHQTVSQDGLRPGDTYVMCAIGAGFHWGTLCLRQ